LKAHRYSKVALLDLAPATGVLAIAAAALRRAVLGGHRSALGQGRTREWNA